MKRFLFRTSLFAGVILLVLLLFEAMFRQVPNQFRLKFGFLDSEAAAAAEVLFFGSSQSCYGIRPDLFDRPAFNLANLSQSVELDFAIYRKYADRLAALETVFLELSYFSLGQDTYVEDAGREKIYDHYLHGNPFRILCSYPTFYQNLRSCYDYYIRHQDDVTGSMGQKISHVVQDEAALLEDARISAARHLMAHKDNRPVYLEFIDALLARNIRVVLHTPPTTSAYNQLKDRDQQEHLEEFIGYLATKYPGTRVRYHDFSADEDFQRVHFMDSNHLNAEGSLLYTEKLQALSY